MEILVQLLNVYLTLAVLLHTCLPKSYYKNIHKSSYVLGLLTL